MDWATRCIVGFGVVWSRGREALQKVVNDAPPAYRYFSDGFPTYARLLYSGTHTVAPGKSETFSVEGDNAELRHYPTRALSGVAGAQEPLFQPVSLGLDAGGGLIRVRLEPAAAGQARLPEAAGRGL